MELFEQYEKIENLKTKKYFEEVLVSYNNRNYRSSVVMLYSVVIYDIISKLKELDDLYEQEWAHKTIETINAKRQREPKSPEWEKFLIDSISKQSDFISLSTIEEINHLREIRNQCAHPAIDNNDELFTPSRYDADSLISRMLNEILTVPAMFTGKVTNYITELIAQITGDANFGWDDKVTLTKSFRKFFKHMNDKVFTKVFKDMWHLTFFIINEDCNKNRFANMLFLHIMLEERHSLLIAELEREKDFFNKISSEALVIRLLCILLRRNDYLLPFIDDTSKSLIKKASNVLMDVQAYAWFSFDTMEEYIDNFLNKSDLSSFSNVIIEYYKISPKFNGYREYYKTRVIAKYLNSSDFDCADRNYNLFIYPIIYDLSKEEAIKILRESENNPQVWRRYNTMVEGNRERLLNLVSVCNIQEEELKEINNFYKMYTENKNQNTNSAK